MSELIITNRAKRVGRATVAARYRSERERTAIMAGKLDTNQNVLDAMRAAQFMMDEMLPCLTICEIALDAGDTAILKVNASAIRKARTTE